MARDKSAEVAEEVSRQLAGVTQMVEGALDDLDMRGMSKDLVLMRLYEISATPLPEEQISRFPKSFTELPNRQQIREFLRADEKESIRANNLPVITMLETSLDLSKDQIFTMLSDASQERSDDLAGLLKTSPAISERFNLYQKDELEKRESQIRDQYCTHFIKEMQATLVGLAETDLKGKNLDELTDSIKYFAATIAKISGHIPSSITPISQEDERLGYTDNYLAPKVPGQKVSADQALFNEALGEELVARSRPMQQRMQVLANSIRNVLAKKPSSAEEVGTFVSQMTTKKERKGPGM